MSITTRPAKRKDGSDFVNYATEDVFDGEKFIGRIQSAKSRKLHSENAVQAGKWIAWTQEDMVDGPRRFENKERAIGWLVAEMSDT